MGVKSIKINCPSCGTKLRIPDRLVNRLLNSGRPIPCPKCGTSVSANDSAKPDSSSDSPVLHVARNQQQKGPFTDSRLEQLESRIFRASWLLRSILIRQAARRAFDLTCFGKGVAERLCSSLI